MSDWVTQTLRRLLSVAAILCLGILVCVELQEVAGSVHAQERETVIREAQPRSPFCIELDSHLVTYRTLTVLGAYIPTTDAGRLQFRQHSTGNLSPLFGDEPRWETPNLAVLDMRLVEDRLWATAEDDAPGQGHQRRRRTAVQLVERG